MQPAAVEHRSRRAEDIIDVAFNVTVIVVLFAFSRIQGILVAQQSDASEYRIPGVDERGNGLSRTGAGSVADRHVFGGKMFGQDVERTAAERAERLSCMIQRMRIVRPADDRGSGIVTQQQDRRGIGANRHLFLVYAGFDPQRDRFGRAGRNIIKCRLKRHEIGIGLLRNGNEHQETDSFPGLAGMFYTEVKVKTGRCEKRK